MATNNQNFYLFPSPVKRVKPSNNPFLQSANRARYSQTISPVEEENAKGFEKGESLVVTVTEHATPILPPTAAHLNRDRSQTPSPVEQPQEIRSPTSVRAVKSPGYPPAVASSPESLKVKEGLPNTRATPPLPMRSMFPQYDFGRPLHQQHYVPQRPINPHVAREAVTRDEYSPRVVSPSFSDAFTGGPRTAPSSVVDFPVDDHDTPEVELSSLRDLDVLWKATNGQGPNLEVSDFTLQFIR